MPGASESSAIGQEMPLNKKVRPRMSNFAYRDEYSFTMAISLTSLGLKVTKYREQLKEALALNCPTATGIDPGTPGEH